MPNCSDECFCVWWVRRFIIVLRVSRGADEGFPAARESVGFSDLCSTTLFRWRRVRHERELAPLYSLCADAVMLGERKRLIISDEKEEKKKKKKTTPERCICLGRLVLLSCRRDGWQPWCWVCVFVYRSGAKWPGTGANRRRPCPPTNEQHYSNGVFVVSALCCCPHAAVTGTIAWCTAPSFWCSITWSCFEMHVEGEEDTLRLLFTTYYTLYKYISWQVIIGCRSVHLISSLIF